MRSRTPSLVVAVAAAAAAAATVTATTPAAVVPLAVTPAGQGVGGAADPAPQGRAKNVIMLIGDGMGSNQIDLTSIYEHGRTYRQVTRDPAAGARAHVPGAPTQVFERFGVQTWMSTHSLSTAGGYQSGPAWSRFGWVNTKGTTDSAAAGTALATGHKTRNGVLGRAQDAKTSLRNLTEAFEAAGRSTGVVSSVPFGHATPASYVVHTAARSAKHDIAAQMLSSDVDVIMGAGHPLYDDDAKPRAADWVWLTQAQYRSLAGGKTGFAFVDDLAEFDQLAKPTDGAPLPRRVFGLARVGETLQADRSGKGVKDGTGVLPYEDPSNRGVPTLRTMATGALNVLSLDQDGFFLMVEGGAIDWEGHANNAARLIEETSQFNRTVEAVVDWVEQQSSWDETMVVVTADHETGYLAGPGAKPTWTALSGAKGSIAPHSWHSTNHTNMLVPLYAEGAGSAEYLAKATNTDVLRGRYLDNTDVAAVQFNQLRR